MECHKLMLTLPTTLYCSSKLPAQQLLGRCSLSQLAGCCLALGLQGYYCQSQQSWWPRFQAAVCQGSPWTATPSQRSLSACMPALWQLCSLDQTRITWRLRCSRHTCRDNAVSRRALAASRVFRSCSSLVQSPPKCFGWHRQGAQVSGRLRVSQTWHPASDCILQSCRGHVLGPPRLLK